MGTFTIGFCGEEKKGPHTRWCMNPYVFDNTYFKELMLRDQSKYYKTEADLKLMQSDSLKNWVEAYAQDEELFFSNYAKAHVKVSELGQESNLLSEFEPEKMTTGGYLEESRLKRFITAFRASYTATVTGQDHRELIEAEFEKENQKQIEEK